MLRRIRVLAAMLVLGGPASDAAQRDWAALAAGDLRSAYALVAEHHPGPVDVDNPAFRRWHEDGLAAGLAVAERVDTYAGYAFALRRYVAGFRDGHLNLSLPRPPAAWPGFLVTLRAGKYLVRRGEAAPDGAPPEGAELVACDGLPPAERMRRDVFPFQGNPDLAASWTELAPLLLVDAGNPAVPPPGACVFELAGRQAPVRLAWRPVAPAELAAAVERAGFGPAPEPGIRSPGPGVVWLALPSFKPATEAAVAALREAIARAPSFRDARALVLDVRGNRGGNSQWGDDLLTSLFGEAFFAARVRRAGLAPAAADFRVSAANEAYLRARAGELRERFGPASPIVAMADTVASTMAEARRAGRPLCPYREPEGARPSDPDPASPVRARLVLVTDGRCASACLDFLDELFALGPVLHVGAATGADTTYGEVRGAPLASGLARLTFAMKVARGRPRGNNVAYAPAIAWDGDLSDTPGLERRVLALLAPPP